MSLIKCPECEKMFSDKASACPNCACPVDEIVKKEIEINNDNDNNNKVICPECKFENVDIDNYCFKCGVLLPRIDFSKNYDELTKEEKRYFLTYIYDKEKQINLQILAISFIVLYSITSIIILVLLLLLLFTGQFNIYLFLAGILFAFLTYFFNKATIDTENECYKSYKRELERKKEINLRKS